MNYTLEEIARICSGKLVGKNTTVTSAVTDSRSISINDGTLFIAIRTASRDGHSYIRDVYSRGVRAFMVEHDFDTAPYSDAGFVRVSSSVSALQKLAASRRTAYKGTVVAVAGSYGKTIVKEWAAQLAPEGVKVFHSPKSYNSQIGVPLSLLMIEGDEQAAVIEAGISQRGEMEQLEHIIRPDVGIFTTLGAAHDENFANRDEKLYEKLKLFKGCRKIIYNSDCEGIGEALAKTCPSAELIDAAKFTEVYKAMPDRISGGNAAEAVAVYAALGYDTASFVKRLGTLQPVATRLSLKEGINQSVIIDDSYNADLSSLDIALDYLSRVSGTRRRMVILSDIADATFADGALYSQVAQKVARASVETLVCIGEKICESAASFNNLQCQVKFYHSVDEYLRNILSDDITGRAILIKGSPDSHFGRISHSIERKSHTTVLEVDLDAMISNLKIYRSHLKEGTKLTAMVKASSYGHGTFEIANTLQQQGVDFLAVAFSDEGVTLRDSGITMPIVVLNADGDSFDIMVEHRLEPEIYNFRSLRDFAAAVSSYGESEYPIHLKIDSGMHRLGFRNEDLPELLSELERLKKFVRVRSIFSHLCVADEPSQDDYTRLQIAYYDKLSSAIQKGVGYRVIRHLDNTPGMIRFPEAQFDMCRLGVGLYGFGFAIDGLRPISTLKTRIVRIATLHKGDTVGYGRAGVIERDSVIATIPVGYADGLNRHLGCGVWSMLVGGRKAPIVGRICMDSCMIDVTDVPDVKEGDEVVVFSPAKGNTVEDMAQKLNTICYEVMTSISTRVKRIYVKE